jgi:hypothetical protein
MANVEDILKNNSLVWAEEIENIEERFDIVPPGAVNRTGFLKSLKKEMKILEIGMFDILKPYLASNGYDLQFKNSLRDDSKNFIGLHKSKIKELKISTSRFKNVDNLHKSQYKICPVCYHILKDNILHYCENCRTVLNDKFFDMEVEINVENLIYNVSVDKFFSFILKKNIIEVLHNENIYFIKVNKKYIKISVEDNKYNIYDMSRRLLLIRNADPLKSVKSLNKIIFGVEYEKKYS